MRTLDFDMDAFAMLSRTLTAVELGALVRIGAHLAAGRGLRIHRAHLVAGIDEVAWPTVFSALAEHLSLDENRETITALAPGSRLLSVQPHPASVPALAGHRDTTPLLAEATPLVSNVRNVPAEVKTHDLRRHQTILKITWDTAIAIYKEAGKSENTARQVIGQMLKHYKDGPVIHAINELSRRGDVAEPTSWMRAFLEHHYGDQAVRNAGPKKRKGRSIYEAPSESSPPRRVDRPIASAEILGISPERARKIQEKNRLIASNFKDEPK